MTVRAALAEAWLLQDDLTQAAAALGRTPDTLREQISDAQLSTLWRLHGRITFARGEQSRAIALHSRALKHAELAHDSRAIGLAHYELALGYKQVGDSGIVREHLTEAASALHAAGDRRHLALVHSLSAVLLAQSGRTDEATAALRQGERLAMAIHADDVLAGIVHNQANVALMRHRHDEALALAERSVSLHQSLGSGHGLAVALATLGQIFVQLGDLERAEQILNRTLDVRSPVPVPRDDRRRVRHARADPPDARLVRARRRVPAAGQRRLRRVRHADDAVVRVVAEGARREARHPARGVRRSAGDGRRARARRRACRRRKRFRPTLRPAKRWSPPGGSSDAEQRLHACEDRLDPRGTPGTWGEFLRIRGLIHEQTSRPSAAYHDFAQSANVFDLLGERYQAALSHLSLGRLAAEAGSIGAAERYLESRGGRVQDARRAARSRRSRRRAHRAVRARRSRPEARPPVDADEAIVRRLVDAAIFPELLARETATALLETLEAGRGGRVRRAAGRRAARPGRARDATPRWPARSRAPPPRARASTAAICCTESLGRDHDGPRFCAIVAGARQSDADLRRFRMFAAVARQGFELCGARERPPQVAEQASERSLEPLLPGFVCASAAMNRVADQIQRLQGHNLTVLITGESGTGKDLVARAIHVGSPRSAAMFLPYNCTTTTRELADSQLFGHRRGSFTGAVTDQQGLIRSAAGGTLFLDEIGDLPLDIQPKLLRFLEQGEIMPVGETRPLAVDVRVLAATNADLEQRVSEGKFREDLYYRLSVIRIHVPPLRERREEIPHLSTFFLRDACERLGKPDVHLSSATLDLFARYWWPGNVRQLRNEIQRAVAMSPPGGTIEPEQLSPDLAAPGAGNGGRQAGI